MPAVFDQSKNDCLKYCRHSTASQRSTRRGQTVSKRFYPKMVDYLKKALIYGHTSRISS